jgi:SAM-dependent methyltransferase
MTTEANVPADPGDLVQAQYEQWPYPPPWQDLTSLGTGNQPSVYEDFRDLYWAYWPAARYREDLDMLVAGCGTMGAAAFAYLYPQARVVGIDVSSNSLEHEQYLKNKHALHHLALHHCRVEEAASLGLDFDFISVTGVLHHLADPVAGLKALGEVLRPDGVISVMVYGRYPRTGVYMLQELFGLLGLGQSASDIQVVKEILGALPPDHPVQPYARQAMKDLSSPQGLVDTFLHKRDRAYSVAECLELVEGAGLAFQGWEENMMYYADPLGPVSPSVRARLKRLEGPRLWQAVELCQCLQATHRFYVCRKERDPASYRLQFDGEAFLEYVPRARVTRVVPADPVRRQPATIARPPFPPVTLDQNHAALFSQIDGRKSVRQCLLATGRRLEQPEDVAFGRAFFDTLWRLGYMLFRIPAPTDAPGA